MGGAKRGWIALALATLAAPEAEAGAWVRDAAGYYAKASFQRFTSRQFVDASNQVVPLEDARFEGDLLGLYAEVGLGRGVGVVAQVPYAASRNVHLDPKVIYAYRWLGDVEAGVQLGRRLGGVPVSVSLLAKVPMYDNHDPAIPLGQNGAYPILGDGQLDLTAWLAAGGGGALGSWRWWGQVELGYRHRSRWTVFDSSASGLPFVDGVPWHLQGGVQPVVGGEARGWWSVDALGLQNLARDARTRQFVQLSTSLAPRIWAPADLPWLGAVHLELGAAWVPVARNSATGWSWTLGVSTQR